MIDTHTQSRFLYKHVIFTVPLDCVCSLGMRVCVACDELHETTTHTRIPCEHTQFEGTAKMTWIYGILKCVCVSIVYVLLNRWFSFCFSLLFSVGELTKVIRLFLSLCLSCLVTQAGEKRLCSKPLRVHLNFALLRRCRQVRRPRSAPLGGLEEAGAPHMPAAGDGPAEAPAADTGAATPERKVWAKQLGESAHLPTLRPQKGPQVPTRKTSTDFLPVPE
jgi:hypothetical protein